MKDNKLALTGAAVGMMILILDSRAAAEAAAAGIAACIHTVIPSLFPFFLLSGYLTGASGSGSAARFTAGVFASPERSGGIILSGLLGGYPLGARLTSESHRSGILEKADAARLLRFCSQAGPAFLFGMVSFQLSSLKAVWMLWAIQILSAVTLSWLSPDKGTSGTPSDKPLRSAPCDPMPAAIRAMATVCGWVVIFSVVLDFLKRWIFWRFPVWVQVLLCGVMELTNGCMMLHTVESESLRFLLAAVMLNFGGICVLMQTMSLTQGLPLRNYICGKLLQTLLAAAYAGILLGQLWLLIPVVGTLSIRFLKVARKKSGFPQTVGV